MSRQHASGYQSPTDRFASVRCVNCGHLRYLGQEPSDPCFVCPCTQHVIPSEVSDDEQPPAA